MKEKTKRYMLPENEIPRYWYNIQADMVNKPLPPLNPATKQPLKPEDMYPIFAEELCRQELNQTDAWIEIPEQVREMYKYYRSTPLVRASDWKRHWGPRRISISRTRASALWVPTNSIPPWHRLTTARRRV